MVTFLLYLSSNNCTVLCNLHISSFSQTHARGLSGEMNRRRRRATSPAPPVTLPDNDDLLTDILIRLPPRPSSLPRASLVCKRWRRLVTDPAFHRRFRARHRDPPLIGAFVDDAGNPFFRPVLDPPDHIPTERFWMRLPEDDGGRVLGRWSLFGCRHGRILLFNRKQNEIVLWDPDTGDHRRVAVPAEIDGEEKTIWNGAVLCAAAGDDGHVHGGFSSCPFKVVLVGVASNNTQMFACVYSSETGKWSDLISTAAPFLVFAFVDPATLVGHALYWLPAGFGKCILQFDLDSQTLAVIDLPPDPNCYPQILPAQGGSLGLADLSCDSLQIWERKVCSEGVAKWMLHKTYELDKVLDLKIRHLVKLGYAEDINAVFLWTDFGVFMVQLDSLRSKKLWETNIITPIHPYTSTYVAGI